MKHSTHSTSPAKGKTDSLDKNRNILPELQEKEALRIRRKLAAEWNTRRTQAQKDADQFYTADDIQHVTVADIVRLAPPKNSAPAYATYRRSKRISNPGNMTAISLVCAQTGIVASMEIPRIPGFFMEYENPLSSVDNCRAIANKGYAYLKQLDTQILAGILLILADDYGLFRFGPFESGASKNAILRGCGHTALVNAILYIEAHVNSGNYQLIPQLGFTIDTDTRQGDIEARLGNWLKLVDKELTEPTITFSPAPVVSASKRIAKARAEIRDHAKEERKSILTAKKQLSDAQDSVKTLFKDGIFSKKRKDFLLSVLDYNIFQSLSGEIKAGIVMKLSAMEIESRITALIKLFERDAITDLDSLMDEITLKPENEIAANTVKMKTAFELQNNAAVMEQQRAEWKRAQASIAMEKLRTATMQRLQNPVPYNAQLLLSFEGNGYSEILQNPRYPLPFKRTLDSATRAEIQAAFDRVQNWMPAEAVQPIVEPVQESIPDTAIVDMLDIGNGHMVPTAFWNSMSLLKQTLYRRNLTKGAR